MTIIDFKEIKKLKKTNKKLFDRFIDMSIEMLVKRGILESGKSEDQTIAETINKTNIKKQSK